MTGKRDVPRGQSVKIVRRTLADGTVKEYRYTVQNRSRRLPDGDLRQIFNQYSASPEFKRLAPEWKARKLWLYRMIEKDLGWMTISDIEARSARADFYELRDKHAALPHRADKMMQALASALAWAYDRGMIEVNHALRIKPLVDWRQSPHQDKELSLDDEETLTTCLPDDLRRVFLVALYTGLRRGDLCRLQWSMLTGAGWLVLQPGKTKTTTRVELNLPVFALPPLAGIIAEIPRVGKHMLMTDTGHSWSETNLSQRWHRQMIKLEIAGMRLHDTRHATENRMALAGCTEAERNAVTGRPLASGSGRAYVARSRDLALNAYRKWWAYLSGSDRIARFPATAEKAG